MVALNVEADIEEINQFLPPSPFSPSEIEVCLLPLSPFRQGVIGLNLWAIDGGCSVWGQNCSVWGQNALRLPFIPLFLRIFHR
jgi:hypothetical protein